MKDETFQIEQRVKRYWYSDGIGELMGGGVFFLLGVYFSLQQYLGDQSFAGGLLQSGFVVILIAGVFISRWIVNALKARVTYPRTGYVEYRTNKKNANWMRFLSVLMGMAAAMVSMFAARRFETMDALVAVTGLMVSVIFIVKQGFSSGVGRFYFLSAISLVLGGVLSVSGFARGYNLGLYYGLMGIALAVSGGLTLTRYLRKNPMPVEAGNE